ncbi:GNAT family N-acetyltransferase, partial [candidate division GN15 bacterium]|nr:GNAT family N-acetyltransferase [candidate division GN15 bacterium]
LFRDNELVGAMRFHDFRLNVRGTAVTAGGVGGVAVDLMHKKERVAWEMMQFYLHHYRERGAPMALLWPFRPDFYRKMGFGYGAKMNHYQIKPAELPASNLRRQVRFLSAADIPSLVGCHNEYFKRRNGMIEENEHAFFRIFGADARQEVIGFARDGVLEGYAVIAFDNFDPHNFIGYDLRVHQLVYLTREALAGLLGFLQSQLDQVRWVRLSSSDDSLHFLLHDPRNDSSVIERPVHHSTNTAGVGIMYRVIDLARLLDLLGDDTFGAGEMTLGITLEDTFLPQENGRRVLRFANGRAALVDSDATDAEIALPMEDFSSLLMGAVSFERLWEYGRAETSDPALIDQVTTIFRTEASPLCLTGF